MGEGSCSPFSLFPISYFSSPATGQSDGYWMDKSVSWNCKASIEETNLNRDRGRSDLGKLPSGSKPDPLSHLRD